MSEGEILGAYTIQKGGGLPQVVVARRNAHWLHPPITRHGGDELARYGEAETLQSKTCTATVLIGGRRQSHTLEDAGHLGKCDDGPSPHH